MKHQQKDQVNTFDDKVQYYLLSFLKLSVVVAMAFAAYFGELGAFLYCVLSLLLMYIPELIRSKVDVKLPIEFDVVIVVFMYASVFVGKVGQAYEHFWWWDAALHTGSGFIIGYVGFLILYIKVQQKKLQASPFLIGLIIFSLSLAMGAVWEIFEFALDGLSDGNLQRGSLRDTMWDLIVDAIGALLMALIGAKQIVSKQKGFVARWTENFVQANHGFKEKKHAE